MESFYTRRPLVSSPTRECLHWDLLQEKAYLSSSTKEDLYWSLLLVKASIDRRRPLLMYSYWHFLQEKTYIELFHKWRPLMSSSTREVLYWALSKQNTYIELFCEARSLSSFDIFYKRRPLRRFPQDKIYYLLCGRKPLFSTSMKNTSFELHSIEAELIWVLPWRNSHLRSWIKEYLF